MKLSIITKRDYVYLSLNGKRIRKYIRFSHGSSFVNYETGIKDAKSDRAMIQRVLKLCGIK